MKLKVTSGTLQDGYFVDGTMRAVHNGTRPDVNMESEIQFIGTTQNTTLLRSGNVKYQFCHQMRRQDHNNLYYFCLQFTEKASIMKKEGDEDWRYTTLDSCIDLPTNITTMRTTTVGPDLELYLNDTLICKAQDQTFKKGGIGVRSDNIKLFFNTRYEHI